MNRPALVVVALLIALGFVGGRVSTAMLTDTESANATIGTDTWLFHLHNRPTPPTGSTTAQVDLAMDVTAGTATTLYNYATDVDASAAGRVLQPSAIGASETSAARYVSWRSDAEDAARVIDGTVQIRLWSALRAYADGRGVLTAYLRDYDPGTGLSTEIGSATLDQASWSGGSAGFVEKLIDVPVAAYTLAGGHQLELKLVAGSASLDDVWLAYDTAAHPSSVRLP